MSADPLWGNETEGRRVVPVRGLDLVLEPGGWPEAEAFRSEIDAHFAQRRAVNPHLWNGAVLLLRDYEMDDGHLRGRFRQTDFATFLWWRDRGWPQDMQALNAFSLAAIEGADGAFLMGVMGPHTASAGCVYFPGGTPDLSNVTPAGQVDLEASAWQELREETGLGAADVAQDLGFVAVFDGPRLALMRRLVLRRPAAAAAAQVRDFLAREALPELTDMMLVRGPGDFTPQMAPFALAYMQARWSADRS
ncbi:NUDIX hydrolase [Xanthobacter sp. ZOL 2024]